MNPLALLSLQSQMTELMLNTQTVITLRLLGMSGAIPAPRGENDRMVTEKAPAMVKAYAAGAKAVMSGSTPDQIISAAMAPLSQKVRANRKRLMK
ncbi:MAG: antifreeze protein [Sulfitobacter sp.]